MLHPDKVRRFLHPGAFGGFDGPLHLLKAQVWESTHGAPKCI